MPGKYVTSLSVFNSGLEVLTCAGHIRIPDPTTENMSGFRVHNFVIELSVQYMNTLAMKCNLAFHSGEGLCRPFLGHLLGWVWERYAFTSEAGA